MNGRTLARRIWRFNAVGAMGFVVQLAALAALHGALGLGLAAATAAAVELAVLHNFFWHERWTWSDRGGGGLWGRLLRFNLGTGLISIAVNMGLMEWLAGRLNVPYLAANVAAVASAAVANFAVADRMVFRAAEEETRSA